LSAATRSQVRVRYAETDQMGITYHGVYFVWFEVGRVEYIRERGVTYRDLEEKEDLRLPVIDVQARFLKPSFYDDLLEIHTRLAEVTGVRIGFEHEVFREGTEGPLAMGRTVVAAVDRQGRPRRLGEDLRRRLES
jgi:acyl-CoA thioester hydrolase